VVGDVLANYSIDPPAPYGISQSAVMSHRLARTIADSRRTAATNARNLRFAAPEQSCGGVV
jgi:hypothetical protein